MRGEEHEKEVRIAVGGRVGDNRSGLGSCIALGKGLAPEILFEVGEIRARGGTNGSVNFCISDYARWRGGSRWGTRSGFGDTVLAIVILCANGVFERSQCIQHIICPENICVDVRCKLCLAGRVEIG